MTYDFSRIYERPWTQVTTGKVFKIYSVHEDNFCIDIPHTMLISNLKNHIKSKIDNQKWQLGKTSECPHNYNL